jgi:transposase
MRILLMAKTEDLWVGLDTGEADLCLCILDDLGKPLVEKEMRGTPKAVNTHLAPLKKQIRMIGVEASASGILIARGLIELGYQVSVFEAERASKFLAIRANKTDLNDARGIADLARLGGANVSRVHVKSAEMERLWGLLSTRESIVRQRVAMEAFVRSMFVARGGRLNRSKSQTKLRENISFALELLKEKNGVDLSDEVLPLADLCCGMRQYAENLDTRLNDHARSNALCRRFMEISGIGPLSALSFYSAICDPYRFKRNADIGPYLGMVPRVRQSGQSAYHLPISGRGNAMVRANLVRAAAWQLRSGNSDLQDWGRQVAERAGMRKAKVAVARKLGVVMIAMWKTGQPFQARCVVKP